MRIVALPISTAEEGEILEGVIEGISPEIPSWLSRPWTWKRSSALVFLWFSMIWIFVAHIISCSFLGAIKGFGHGLVKDCEDTWKDFTKYWKMFEECE